MISDIFPGCEDMFLNQSDIALNEAFLLEGRGGKRQFDWTEVAINLKLIVAVADLHSPLGIDDKADDYGIVIDLQIDVKSLPCVT